MQDLSMRDTGIPSSRRPASDVASSIMDDRASSVSRASNISRAMSYASTAATTVSISGEISSQLHGGYHHPLARQWQAERQLTKVSHILSRASNSPPKPHRLNPSSPNPSISL